MPSATRLLLTSLAAALLAPACMHDWDSLEAPEGSGGGSDGGGGGTGTGSGTGTGTGSGTATGTSCPSDDTSVEGLCATYCGQVNDCVTNDPACVGDCEAAMAGCPPGTREQIRSCMDTIDLCSCEGLCGVGSSFDAGFLVCIGTTVNCWDPPHSCS